MYLTYRYKLLPTRKQRLALKSALDSTRTLYNAALQQRIDAYRLKNKTISLYEQYTELKHIRADAELGFSLYPAVLMRWPLERVNEAFKGFFARAKKGEKAGFPRFRSASRWNSFGLTEWAGVRIEKNRLCINGLGGSKKGSGIRLHTHRPLPDDASFCSLTVTRKGNAWYANIVLDVPVTQTQEFSEADVRGWDWGRENTMTSDQGLTIERQHIFDRYKRRVKQLQSRINRARKGSKGRKRDVKDLGRVKRREADARNTMNHQDASRVVKLSPWVAVEKLSVKNMSRSASGTVEQPGTNVAQKSGLNRSINDGSPARLMNYISYKAERAGGICVMVNPRNTSQNCSGCGTRVKKSLNERVHSCHACGLTLTRDENAGRNIRMRGIEQLRLRGVVNSVSHGDIAAPAVACDRYATDLKTAA